VRWFAVGVGEDDEGDVGSGDTTLGRQEASRFIIAALIALPRAEHVLIRPLHPAARPNLLAFFGARRRCLKSLVIIARDTPDGAGWQGFLNAGDAEVVLDGLERLNVDVWPSANRQVDPFPRRLLLPPRLSLTHLCLDVNYSAELTYNLLCPTLTHLQLYFEHLRPSQEAALPLSKAPLLRHLHYSCNPPLLETLERDYDKQAARVLDVVLPSLLHLETLVVSATDISSDFLRLLPPRLHHVTTHTYNYFKADPLSAMLDILCDSSTETRSLQRLTFCDGAEQWKRRARAMEKVCASRGIRFKIVRDGEQEDEGGWSGWR
jgi:hypothetical protein